MRPDKSLSKIRDDAFLTKLNWLQVINYTHSWGARGRGFESRRPDHRKPHYNAILGERQHLLSAERLPENFPRFPRISRALPERFDKRLPKTPPEWRALDWPEQAERERALVAHCRHAGRRRQAFAPAAPTCPHCGAELPVTAIRCDACGRLARAHVSEVRTVNVVPAREGRAHHVPL